MKPFSSDFLKSDPFWVAWFDRMCCLTVLSPEGCNSQKVSLLDLCYSGGLKGAVVFTGCGLPQTRFGTLNEWIPNAQHWRIDQNRWVRILLFIYTPPPSKKSVDFPLSFYMFCIAHCAFIFEAYLCFYFKNLLKCFTVLILISHTHSTLLFWWDVIQISTVTCSWWVYFIFEYLITWSCKLVVFFFIIV